MLLLKPSKILFRYLVFKREIFNEGMLGLVMRMVLYQLGWMLLTQAWRCSQESLKPEIVLDKTLPQITLPYEIAISGKV